MEIKPKTNHITKIEKTITIQEQKNDLNKDMLKL